VELEIQNLLAASASETTAGLFIIVSKRLGDSIELLLIENVEPRKSTQSYLRELLLRAKGLSAIDSLAARDNLSSEWAPLLTRHLQKLHEIYDDEQDVISSTAWRYKTLIAWGESSAARELALALKVPVHTIHSRLRIARNRGILSSPGSGSRLGG
jgi:DNA phosphorothioation-dependent restriction protein DptG